MKEKGLMILNTNEGSRKMHYVLINNKIYTSTSMKSNKVQQIKNNNIVTIDDKSTKYLANLIDVKTNPDILDMYRNKMGRMNRLINIYIGAKDPVIIELNKI